MSLDWVTTAVLSAAILGMVHVIDSHLISKRMPSFRAYLLVVGIFIFLVSIAFACFFPLPPNIGVWPLSMAVLAGITRAASVIILLYLMKKEEVSIVIPIANTYPIFVALIAMPTLNETMNSLQWVAIVIVVFGVLLTSVRLNTGTQITWLGKPLILLAVSSILWAVSDVMTKYALDYMSTWNMYWISHLILPLAFFSISFRPSVFREIMNYQKRNSSVIMVALNETMAVTALILFYWSMQRGPVSLVSAVYSSRPLFVFLYAVIISRFSHFLLEEQTSRATLLLRFIAISLIVGGIIMIYLTK
ncbi:MAG: EamA family transporter [Dehalococcoidia bacterium]|nr:EamA family transporter [Dehalococcoidia bacterium]